MILLNAKNEELIVWRKENSAYSSELFLKHCRKEEREGHGSSDGRAGDSRSQGLRFKPIARHCCVKTHPKAVTLDKKHWKDFWCPIIIN